MSTNLLNQLRTAICKKKIGKFSNGVLLQEDNAGVLTSKLAMDVVEWNRYELILHPAYSQGLAPIDFPFSKLRKEICGCHFQSDEEVMAAVEECVNANDPAF